MLGSCTPRQYGCLLTTECQGSINVVMIEYGDTGETNIKPKSELSATIKRTGKAIRFTNAETKRRGKAIHFTNTSQSSIGCLLQLPTHHKLNVDSLVCPNQALSHDAIVCSSCPASGANDSSQFA
eukprot:13425336-Heterocapsa_arctica.AAC.1